jgi:transcriptional regulator with XRE-family HTH domain
MRLLCRLREARGDRTLAALAEVSGVSPAYLSQIETGRLLPRDEWIAGMERAYGLEYGRWYGKTQTLVALGDGEAA